MKIPEILQTLIDQEYIYGTSDKDLEDVLGPNYRTLINFWLWIENNCEAKDFILSEEEDTNVASLWDEIDEEYVEFVEDIQWELIGDDSVESLTHVFVYDKVEQYGMSSLISNCATEILAMDKIIESEWELQFIPFLMKIRVDG